jgi:hypothetical protein
MLKIQNFFEIDFYYSCVEQLKKGEGNEIIQICPCAGDIYYDSPLFFGLQ